MSVEKTLEPLVLQVTTLVNSKSTSKKKKGKRLKSLIISLEAIFSMAEVTSNESPQWNVKQR